MRTTSVDYVRGCSCLSCTNRTSGEEAPTECTEYTEPLAEKGLPQMTRMFTDVGGYGIPAIPTLPNSVYSVNSVGEQRTITICVHPCHPWEKRYSRRTHTRNLLAEKSLPQMSTDVHRLGGYGIPAIPTLPNSVYSVNSVGEQRTLSICVNL